MERVRVGLQTQRALTELFHLHYHFLYQIPCLLLYTHFSLFRSPPPPFLSLSLTDFKTLICSLCTFLFLFEQTNTLSFYHLTTRIMATEEEKENPYEGLGTGGKFRKRPFRRTTQTTPYDRPPNSLRNPTRNNSGWLSKVVNPAQRLITYGAHSLFSSLFRKRLPPPPPSIPSPSGPETEQNVSDSHQEESTLVSNNSSDKQQGSVGNGECDIQINCSDGGGLTELEKLLRQKTFTRSEIDHLTALMRSRTVDASTPNREEEMRTEVVPSKPMPFERKDDDPVTPIVEKGTENRLALTTYVTSNVPIEDVASPAELAKAYMGSRPSKVSSAMLGVQSPALWEGPAFLKSENLPLNSPIMSIVPRTRHAGAHENGFAIPRTRGRSAIYSMARTPYARIYPTSTLKGGGLAVEGEPSSSTQTLDQDMLYGSKLGAGKRRSSVLDNDVGSVGPIRRIRHKANLYAKGSSLPLSGPSLSIAGSRLSIDASQQTSSSMGKPIILDEVKHSHMKLSEENVDGTRPSKSRPSHSKSSEMASKILQQLDKFVSPPKEKSSELRLPAVNDKTPMKLSPSMLHGQARRSMETIDSLKLLDTAKDNRFDVAPGNLSDNVQKLTSQIDKVENGLAPSDELVPAVTDADFTKPRNEVISTSKSVVNSFVTNSVSYLPQKKRAFHMSAHEDCLDMDDDAYPNGAVPSAFPVENETSRSTAMAEKATSGTEATARENTRPLSVVMPSKSSTLGGEAHVGTMDESRVGEKGDASTSVTSSIPDSIFKPATEATQTSFGSDKPASPNGSIAIPPAFNFGNKVAPSKEITNSDTIFGMEKVVSSKEPGADTPLVNFGSNGNVDKVPQMLFASPSVGDSPFPKFGASDSKLGSSTSSATAVGANDSKPIVHESGNADSKTNMASVRPSELTVSSAASTSLFTSPTSTSTFGQSNGSLASSQHVFSSSSLAASSSSIITTSTPAIIPSSNSSSPSPLVASSSSTTPIFKFGPSAVPSTGLPVPSSVSEPVETKNRQDAGNVNLSSSAFGSSSAAVGSTGSGFFGISSSAITTVSSPSQGSAIGASNGSVLNAQASPASSGFPTSTQTQSVPFGSSASSPSFGLTGNTAFSSGNSLFPSSSPAPNTAFSFGSSSFPSSNSAANIFNSGTAFGHSTSASSSAANSFSSNSGTNSTLFGSSAWQPSKSSPFGSAFNSSMSSSGFSFGISTASVASTTSPTMFSSTPQFSFTSAASTTSSQPAFGNPNSVFAFGSSPVNNDQMTMEDSMAEDSVQATPPATPIFGQQPAQVQPTPAATPIFGQQPAQVQSTPPANPIFGQQPAPVQSNFVFGASAPSGASPFQFGSQPNITPPNPSPFQASGSLEFSAGGGSFSLGTGGGDKSGRRIVKVKNRQRKR
ncbi:hypothetical protein RIF29_21299 [Crotalaria pallida]|uniref:Nuclear pore complex protein NUP1-like n=1 Tax=Crotalaria pallida TaxID=3830 RepID=A0AAN9I5U1_CROPI